MAVLAPEAFTALLCFRKIILGSFHLVPALQFWFMLHLFINLFSYKYFHSNTFSWGIYCFATLSRINAEITCLVPAFVFLRVGINPLLLNRSKTCYFLRATFILNLTFHCNDAIWQISSPSVLALYSPLSCFIYPSIPTTHLPYASASNCCELILRSYSHRPCTSAFLHALFIHIILTTTLRLPGIHFFFFYCHWVLYLTPPATLLPHRCDCLLHFAFYLRQ